MFKYRKIKKDLNWEPSINKEDGLIKYFDWLNGDNFMSKFDVSIVIPTYNRPQLITKALDSIETQETNYSYEVIVQDNSSNELTKKLLEENSHKYTFKPIYEKNNEVLTYFKLEKSN